MIITTATITVTFNVATPAETLLGTMRYCVGSISRHSPFYKSIYIHIHTTFQLNICSCFLFMPVSLTLTHYHPFNHTVFRFFFPNFDSIIIISFFIFIVKFIHDFLSALLCLYDRFFFFHEIAKKIIHFIINK